MNEQAQDGQRALSFAILHERDEIAAARRTLEQKGLLDYGSALVRGIAKSRLAGLLRQVGVSSLDPAARPDPLKAWDTLRCIEAVMATASKDDPILDVGCFASPVLPILRRLGYTNLHGIDLDPRVAEMPSSGEIEYRVGDMMSSRWEDGSFSAITALSVIEHGFDQDALLGEVARLLRPRGAFIFSTDFWPEKISTQGKVLFGLDWRIFSRQEIEDLIAAARDRALEPVEPPGTAIDAHEPPAIRYDDRSYTFLFGALVRASPGA